MDWVVLGAVVGGVAFVVAIVSVALTVAIMRRRVGAPAPAAAAPVRQATEHGAPLLVPPRAADEKQAVFETAQMWGPFPRRRTPTAPPHHDARIWLVPEAALEERTTDEIILGRAETTADVAHAKTDKHAVPPKTASAELRDMRSALDEFVLTLDDNTAFRPAT